MSENQRFEDLLATVKRISELQRAGAIPSLGNTPDPTVLEDLRHSDPQAYVAALQRSANDIRRILSTMDGGQRAGPAALLSPRPKDYHIPPPPPSLPPLNLPDEGDEDLYENTGPGSRLMNSGMGSKDLANHNGKHFKRRPQSLV